MDGWMDEERRGRGADQDKRITLFKTWSIQMISVCRIRRRRPSAPPSPPPVRPTIPDPFSLVVPREAVLQRCSEADWWPTVRMPLCRVQPCWTSWESAAGVCSPATAGPPSPRSRWTSPTPAWSHGAPCRSECLFTLVSTLHWCCGEFLPTNEFCKDLNALDVLKSITVCGYEEETLKLGRCSSHFWPTECSTRT